MLQATNLQESAMARVLIQRPPVRGLSSLLRRLAVVAAAVGCSAAMAQGNLSDDDKARALQRASDSVLGVETRTVKGARSADTLGERRSGSGIVVGSDGLVLTIGYLLLEADTIDIVLDNRQRVPARTVAYDVATGFGLAQSLVPLPVQPAPLGTAREVQPDEPLLVASGGNEGAVSLAKLLSRRDFSGYWEYHIEGALFTAPARRDHSGAGLFNDRGELVGVGSLFVTDAAGAGQRSFGNMFVPIDLLKPILAELRQQGRSKASVRAWLGLNCTESAGKIRIMRVSPDSPAETAGLRVGDEIVGIDDVEVHDLATLYKTLWTRGEPERDVRLVVSRDARQQTVTVRTVDRARTLRQPQGI
jgi:serine protease Do